MSGGPGTGDPETFATENLSLWNLVAFAWGVELDNQLVGPGWIKDENFDVRAKVPEGATRDQLRLMMQNLLVERFGMRTHREKREVKGYNLTVMKDGPKLKPPTERVATEATPGPFKTDADGCPVIPRTGRPFYKLGTQNRAVMGLFPVTMPRFAELLTDDAGGPVTDRTGLTGDYDIELCWAPASAGMNASDGPTIFQAVRQRLGLSLDPTKTLVDIVVIDHIERNPTAN